MAKLLFSMIVFLIVVLPVFAIPSVLTTYSLLILIGNSFDCCLNRVYKTKLPAISDEAKRLHESLFIVDLHADTMLWNRDPRKQSQHGHVDLPRLKKGNVALQVFGVVTKTVGTRKTTGKDKLIKEEKSKCLLTEEEKSKCEEEGSECRKFKRCQCLSGKQWVPSQTDWLQLTRPRWPFAWPHWFGVMFDLEKRAINQAELLKFFADNSQGKMRLITSANDLKQLIEDRREARRNDKPPPVGALIALEGAHWLGEGDQTVAEVKQGVEDLYKANFRMLAPVHRFNNSLGASSEGCDQLVGFNENGKAFNDEVNSKNLILDLAHATDVGIIEQAKSSKSNVPVIVSHTGLREHCSSTGPHLKPLCDIARNMSDEAVRAVARTGGVVGVGIWIEAAGKSMDNVVDAFVAAHTALNEPAFVNEMRARNPNYDPFDHIALGSDFDGAVRTPINVAQLPYLTQALVSRRNQSGEWFFDDDAIRKIFGVNACRVFATRLPEGSPARAEEICLPLMKGIANPDT